ncbi:MAG: hypothetical protein QXS48_04300 [Candidatus Aenigmatarchaeota archaeon]
MSFTETTVNKVKNDVFSFTSDILSLENNSKVILADLSNSEFENTFGYFDEKEFKIFVNSYGLDERKLKQYSACVISFFQPYAFYLENVENFLREDENLKETREVFTGIGKWVERATLNYLENLGYAFDHEIKSSFEDYRNLEGFKVCQELWENVKKLTIQTFGISGKPLELEKIHQKIIRVLIKNISRESNPSLFLRKLSQKFLGYDEILSLYLESGEYALVKPKDVSEIEEYYEKLKSALAFDSNFREYKLSWEPLNKLLKNFGLRDLYEKSLKIFENFSEALGVNEKLSELEKEEEKSLENHLRDLLTDIECSLGFLRKEKPTLIALQDK